MDSYIQPLARPSRPTVRIVAQLELLTPDQIDLVIVWIVGTTIAHPILSFIFSLFK